MSVTIRFPPRSNFHTWEIVGKPLWRWNLSVRRLMIRQECALAIIHAHVIEGTDVDIIGDLEVHHSPTRLGDIYVPEQMIVRLSGIEIVERRTTTPGGWKPNAAIRRIYTRCQVEFGSIMRVG